MHKIILLFKMCLVSLILCFSFGELRAQVQANNFKESFESETFPPTGWTASNNKGWSRDKGTTFGPGNVTNGTYAAMADMYNLNTGVKAELITPVLDFSSMTNPVFKFDWNARPGDSPQPIMKVFLSEDGGATFPKEIFSYEANGLTAVWKTEQLFLEAKSNVKLKFQVISDYGSSNVFLDNIRVVEAPDKAVSYLSTLGMSFDVVLQNQSKEYGLYFRNLGAKPLVLESTDIKAPFRLKEDLPITLQKGEQIVLNFEFAPTNKGPFQQTVNFNFNGETSGDKTLILNGVCVPESYSYEGFEEPLLDIWDIETIVNLPWSISDEGVEGKKQLVCGSKFQAAEFLSSTSRITTPDIVTRDGDYLVFYAYKVGKSKDTKLEIQYLNESGEYVKFKNVPLSSSPSIYAYDLTELPVDHARLAFFAITGDGYSGVGIDGLRFPYTYLGEDIPPVAKMTYPNDFDSDLPLDITLTWEREAKARGFYLYVGKETNPKMPEVGKDLPEGWMDMKKATSKKLDLEYKTTYRWLVVPYNENGIPVDNKIRTFTTYNDPTISAYPYYQGFEKQAPPVGWINPDRKWYQNSLARSGKHAAATSYNHKGPAIMYTPNFVVGDNNLRVCFYWKDDGLVEKFDRKEARTRVIGSDTTYFEVSADNGATWTILDRNVGKSLGATKKYSKSQHNLTSYKNKSVQFRWRDINWQEGKAIGVCVDDFKVEAIPTTPLAELNLTSWNFGQVKVGKKESCPFRFSLTNDGIGTLKVKEIIGLEGTCFSTDLNPKYVNLTYAKSKQFRFYVNPDSKGAKTTKVVLDCGEAGKYEIELSAEGFVLENVNGDFENAMDFSNEVAPFISIDKDKINNYYSGDFYFKGEKKKNGFFVFNPKATYPPIDNQKEYRAHSGDKYMVAFTIDSPNPEKPIQNDDWLITPKTKVKAGDKFTFWAKSITDAYLLERLRVLVTEGDPSDTDNYTKIHAEEYYNIPADAWNILSFDLSEYAGKNISVAIQCVSLGSYMLMIDDVAFESATGEKEVIDFEGDIKVYPNPADDKLSINLPEDAKIQLIDVEGRLWYEQNILENGSNDLNTSGLPEGVYILKFESKDKSYSKKLVIRH
ncbi:MAG: choice-of-anchor J domain-containing protein [Bacteroidales bacterium]